MKIKVVGNHRVLPLLNIFNRQTFPRAKTHIVKHSKKFIHIAKAMPNIENICLIITAEKSGETNLISRYNTKSTKLQQQTKNSLLFLTNVAYESSCVAI
jgi:hypothetical protein